MINLTSVLLVATSSSSGIFRRCSNVQVHPVHEVKQFLYIITKSGLLLRQKITVLHPRTLNGRSNVRHPTGLYRRKWSTEQRYTGCASPEAFRRCSNMGKFEDEQQAAARSRADGEHVPGQSAHGVDAFCRHRRLHYHFHSRLSHLTRLLCTVTWLLRNVVEYS